MTFEGLSMYHWKMNWPVVVLLFDEIITSCNKLQMSWLQGKPECRHVIESCDHDGQHVGYFSSLNWIKSMIPSGCNLYTFLFFFLKKTLNSITAKINILPCFHDWYPIRQEITLHLWILTINSTDQWCEECAHAFSTACYFSLERFIFSSKLPDSSETTMALAIINTPGFFACLF